MDFHPVKRTLDLADPLTRREMEILALMAADRSNAEIAEQLSLALSSVKWYAQQIYSKLGVENRKQAVIQAREIGLLEGPGRTSQEGPGLPSGTVTFLFTDIEGSTSLWEQMPEAMRAAVAQHHAILRQAIEANGGLVFQVIGDAFQAAFRLASDGLCAALAAQRGLHAAPWGPAGPLKVRMGLHTGPAEAATGAGPDGRTDAPYQVGHTLNRAARIMSAGYGGQVLLSQEAADLVERSLGTPGPLEGVSLLDLGQQRLKGMQRLEHLFQMVAPDLPQEFPPLATGVAHPNNLPAQLTSFIGREKEIAGLQDLILNRPAGLVTLTGSGGTGKTRLALRAAEQLLEQFPQGIWLVELAPLSDPDLVPRAVAEALGVREDPQRSLLQVLLDYLRDRRMLLILDNCEHVVGAAADLTSALLHACPRLHILATSREILGVQGEAPFRCPSLGQSEAQRLFVERAQTIAPGFTLTEANAAVIQHICRRLDGIPLAIELAAARTRMLSVDQIAARLDQAFRLLTGGSRSVLPRHQTLKALIDWSYNLLSVEERALLLRLSVFAGGWVLEAAEQVCSDREKPDRQNAPLLPSEQILDLLGQLIDKSLIQIEQIPADEPRYRMLETVRQFARERLVESGGAEDLHERHLDYFLALALQAEPHLRTREARRWLDRLDREMDNLRQGLEWSLYGSVEKGLLLASALLWFWHTRNHRAEGVEWLNRLLAAEEARSAARPREKTDWIARGRGLNVLSELSGRFVHAIRHGQVKLGRESKEIFESLGDAFQRDRAISLFSMAGTREEYLACRQLFQEVGDLFYAAECTLELSSHALEINDLDQMVQFCREDLAMRETLGDVDGEGFALFVLAMWEAYCGDPIQAIQYSRKSMACFESVGNREMLSFPLSILSLVALAKGDYEQAIEHIDEERALGQELASPTILVESFALEGLVAWTRKAYDRAVQCAQKSLEIAREMTIVWRKPANYVLGRVALSRGDYPLAQAHLMELLPKTRASAISPNDLRPLHLMGVLAARQQKMRPAATLMGALDGMYGRWAHNVISPAEQDEYDQVLAAVRADLGQAAFAAAWEAGRSMTEEQVRKFAGEVFAPDPDKAQS